MEYTSSANSDTPFNESESIRIMFLLLFWSDLHKKKWNWLLLLWLLNFFLGGGGDLWIFECYISLFIYIFLLAWLTQFSLFFLPSQEWSFFLLATHNPHPQLSVITVVIIVVVVVVIFILVRWCQSKWGQTIRTHIHAQIVLTSTTHFSFVLTYIPTFLHPFHVFVVVSISL